jgi:hypothetical protein
VGERLLERRDAKIGAKCVRFKFASGETLSLHYRTLGSAGRDDAGEIVNGVLLLQGDTGTGANWLRPTLANPPPSVAKGQAQGK